MLLVSYTTGWQLHFPSSPTTISALLPYLLSIIGSGKKYPARNKEGGWPVTHTLRTKTNNACLGFRFFCLRVRDRSSFMQMLLFFCLTPDWCHCYELLPLLFLYFQAVFSSSIPPLRKSATRYFRASRQFENLFGPLFFVGWNVPDFFLSPEEKKGKRVREREYWVSCWHGNEGKILLHRVMWSPASCLPATLFFSLSDVTSLSLSLSLSSLWENEDKLAFVCERAFSLILDTRARVKAICITRCVFPTFL